MPEQCWHPPSDHLVYRDRLWEPGHISRVSYPEEGNQACFQVEDSSYWFSHRNECILTVMSRLPPGGMVLDIGGGNGFVASAMQRAGVKVVLLEPGKGAGNALHRGVSNVIHASLEDACLRSGEIEAAGAFDVIEHVEDDIGFLRHLRRLLRPGGRFYCTVPAFHGLWSDEDAYAGHHRRYSKDSLAKTMRLAGFEVEYMSAFFTWLVPPVWLLRSLPSRLFGRSARRRGGVDAVESDHKLPSCLSMPVRLIHAWELSVLREGGVLAFGTSLLCVARTQPHL